jgi:PAS domain S-box-containing protein
MYILLIEDSVAEAQLLMENLHDQSEPIEVVHVELLCEGLKLLKSRPFDAVLLDLSLPDSRGLESLSSVKGAVPETAVVVLTGLDDEAIATGAIRLGAEDYLVKGQADSRLLIHSLRYAIERNRMKIERMQSRRKLDLLLKTSVEVVAEKNLESLVQRVVDAACELTEARMGISVQGEADGEFRVMATSQTEGMSKVPPLKAFKAERGGIYLDLMTHRDSIRVSRQQLPEHPVWWGLPEGHVPLSGLLGARLIGSDAAASGLIMVSDRRQGEFSEEDESLLRQLAAITSLAIQHIEARTGAENRAREAEDRRRILEVLMENMPDLFVMYDAQRRTEFLNAAYLRLCGRPESEILGKRSEELWPPSITDAYLPTLIRTQETRTQQRTVATVQFPHQPPITLSIVYIPLLDEQGKLSHIIGVSHNVTEHKQAEMALQEADRRKDEFLANISHELRTPMTAILGMTELALSEELPPVVRDYLETAKDSAQVLLALLNEILDFSRVKAGKLDFESVPFRLSHILDETMKALAVRAYEKGLELACDLPGTVPDHLVGDPLRLRQVLINLVGNAIKFTERGEVTVRVGVKEQSDCDVCLEFDVADTGIGISPENLDRIFAPFAQADSSTTRHFGGTGLGLAIASQLTAMMGGRLWVESELGRGSVFHFTTRLSRQQTTSDASRTDVLGLDQLQGIRVLVADDNPTQCHILQTLLSMWSMRPETAVHLHEAVEKLHAAAEAGAPFPLVIVDAVMPGINDATLADWLDDERPLAGSLILLVSAADRQAHFKGRKGVLSVTYLEKPISQHRLLIALRHAMGLTASADAAMAVAGSDADQRNNLRPLRVLLAEDTPANQKLVTRVLGRRGHAVNVASNGREAAELAAAADFDVILMDVQMPVMDGFQATSVIRSISEPRKAHVPIVAMTAHAMKGDQERCLNAGMDAYIAKPINVQELVQLVEQIAQNRD